MEWATWAPWMDRIRRDFGYDEEADRASARRLEGILEGLDGPPVVDYAWQLLSGSRVVVAGAADDAADGIRRSKKKHVLVTADGATSAAREAGRVPDVVVTDLDGRVEDQVWAAEQGALVFVHAHGDNADRLERHVPAFPATSLAGTCQVQAFGRLVNPGGFTDGDRACFLAHALGARQARLVGFDLEGPAGRWTGDHDPAVKRRKLAWCGRLLGLLQSETGFPLDPAFAPPDSASTQSA